LVNKNLVQQIVPTYSPNKNISFEISHSLHSIFVFGFSGIALVYLVRTGRIALLPDTFANVILGIFFLTAWNELYFFTIHRLMHLPFFYRRVHKIHHQSKIPTVYSVFSFHWFEALLLSGVPLTICPFFAFSPLAIFLYPLSSILLNFAGHCNYRFGKGTGASWQLFGTRHSQHHFRNTQNYGFATHFFDWLLSSNKKSHD
jgi:sterol desaturase/sphingolipid hydroxylase (fatty acid hydroxylase superfamily)